MSFRNLLQNRYSVRAYKSISVEKDKLDQLFDAVRLAPTAANRQPFRFFVLETKNRGEDLLKVYNREWFIQAPLVIAACAEPSKAWRRKDGKNYADIDTTIAMDHFILAAADLGLGTCWIAAFDPEKLRKLLKLSPELEPIALTPLGYPDDAPKMKKRKEIDEIVTFL